MSMANVHLSGRAPHADIDDLFTMASKCRAAADIDAVEKKLQHVSAVFAAVLRDFRATLLANEHRRGIPPPGSTPPSDNWCPMHDTFSSEDELTPKECPMLLRPRGHVLHPVAFVRLEEWRTAEVGSYDDRPQAIATMIMHDQTHAVRQLIDGGVNLSNFWRTPSHVGGGLHVYVESTLEAYIWANQLLLVGSLPWHILASAAGDFDQWARPKLVEGAILLDPRTARQHAAFCALHELCCVYDNRCFRAARHVSALCTALSERTLTIEGLRAYVSERLWPELVRCSHLMLYSEVRHGDVPARVAAKKHLKAAAAGKAKGTKEATPTMADPLADASAPDPPCMQMDLMVHSAIAAVLRQVIPAIEGVKRSTLFVRPLDGSTT